MGLFPRSQITDCTYIGNESGGRLGDREVGVVRAHSLHLVEIVCASVVDVMTEGSSDHGQGLQISEVPLQLSCLEGY